MGDDPLRDRGTITHQERPSKDEAFLVKKKEDQQAHYRVPQP